VRGSNEPSHPAKVIGGFLVSALATAATIAAATTATAFSAAAAVTTTAATATAGAFFARPSFINGEIAALETAAVQSTDRRLRSFGRRHGDKCESAGPSRGTVEHQVNFCDWAMLRKQVLEIVFGGAEGKIAYEQFTIHFLSLDPALS
jgi:hypothetical protein